MNQSVTKIAGEFRQLINRKSLVVVFSKIMRYVSYFARVLPYLVLFLPALLYAVIMKFSSKSREVWLISERGDEARDNAYHLYKYIRTKHPEIDAYFVITDDSADRAKVSQFGNLVRTNSFCHFVHFIIADKLISTHMYGAAPYGKACLPFLKLLPRKKHVFLQHGVTQRGLVFNDENLDLFVCSSRLEVECLQGSSRKVKQAIQILGMCRYDELQDRAKSNSRKTIVMMPTFRTWLEDASRLPNRDEIFRNDPYFLFWNRLISDRKLLGVCEKNDITIVFYPHYRSQKYLHNFRECSHRVVIADRREYDIQDLLINGSMLVTDYSSVFFDFAYMKKPVMYYQFDATKFQKYHYRQGVFSYQEHGFGPVIDNCDCAVDYIIDRIRSNYRMEDKYVDRVSDFFAYTDKKNTERNFEAICEL